MNDQTTEFQKWMQKIKKSTGLSQKQIGEKTVRFTSRNGQMICLNHCRNSVNNWFNGKACPSQTETIVSLALLPYADKPLKSIKEREKRLGEVQDIIDRCLGRRLYCRSLSEALLIGVIVGIYRMEEVPRELMRLGEIVDGVILSEEDRNYYARRDDTIPIENAILSAGTKEEFERVVEAWKYQLQVGTRSIGERVKSIHEENKESMGNLSLQEAICLYAPKMADSHTRIYKSEFSASRSWMIEICMHLHFTREQINAVLEKARMPRLSTEKADAEYYIRFLPTNRSGIPIGSTQWYRERDKKYIDGLHKGRELPQELKIRYKELADMDLKGKMTVLMLMEAYINDKIRALNSINYIPPIDYLLEFFVESDRGHSCLNEIDKELRKKKADFENFKGMIKNNLNSAGNLIDDAVARVEDYEKEYGKFWESFHAYYSMPEKKYGNKDKRSEKQLLTILKSHLLAALSYSIILGRLYCGYLTQDALDDLESIFENDKKTKEGDAKEFRNCYGFFRLFWIMFLDSEKRVYMVEDEMYYSDHAKASDSLTEEEIREAIFETWRLAAEPEDAQI